MLAFYEATEFRLSRWSCDPDYGEDEIKHLEDIKRVLWPSEHREPMLTHFDIKWPNMVVSPIKPSAGGEPGDWKVTLIDWDHAGWAPAYMQKASLFQRLPVLEEIRAQETFCGFHRSQYKEEMDVLMFEGFTLGLL
ncbi:hypothetical protein PMIN06_002500 [Paraphaeosphaeria minitans]